MNPDWVTLNPWEMTSRQEIPKEVAQPSQEAVEEFVEPVEESREAYTPPDPTPVDQTQDVEETRVIEKPKPTAEELERQRMEQERIRQERIERERREEQERIAREAREEQERIERERQAQAERLNNMGRDAFGNQGVGETEGSEKESPREAETRAIPTGVRMPTTTAPGVDWAMESPLEDWVPDGQGQPAQTQYVGL